jgi:hypothetical protein
MDAMPRTTRPSSAIGAGSASTRVPAPSGRNVLRMNSGMRRERVGRTLGGCTTLAPKCESSISSS